MAFAVMPVFSCAQTDQQATASSPISQPLIREGALAVTLAGDLNRATDNEAEAEDWLSAVGIAPRNGWIADYPVTPDIVGELQTAISQAADSGKLSMGKEAALKAFQGAVSGYGLPVKPDTSGQVASVVAPPSYSDSAIEDNYYSDEGPPVITYYAPPVDYAYLYTWVPYPFWGWDFWFPGFFVLADFNVGVHWHYHGHDHQGFISNHFRDPKTGRITRIDPANRFRGGTLPTRGGRTGLTSPAARSGGQAILNKSLGRVAPEASKDRGYGVSGPSPGTRASAFDHTAVIKVRSEYRGYGVTQNPVGTRSSAFEHSVNRQVEHAASDRGFQSRSSAGQVTGGGHGGGSSSSAGRGASGGGGGGFHGGGGGGRR
ncbi:MAG: hypothetical protein ABSA46_17940 [Thermodesulfovibrionales bacterium]